MRLQLSVVPDLCFQTGRFFFPIRLDFRFRERNRFC